jgi:hypothetical protein
VVLFLKGRDEAGEQLSGPALAGQALAGPALAGPVMTAPPMVVSELVARERDRRGGKWELMTVATEEAREDSKRFATGSTSRWWCLKKSTHKIGKLTAAKRRDYLYLWLSNYSSNSFSPQQGIVVPDQDPLHKPSQLSVLGN